MDTDPCEPDDSPPISAVDKWIACGVVLLVVVVLIIVFVLIGLGGKRLFFS